MKFRIFLLTILLIVIGMQTSNLFLVEGLYANLSVVTMTIVMILLATTPLAVFRNFLKSYSKFLIVIMIQGIILLVVVGLGGVNLFPYLRDVMMCWIFILLGYSFAATDQNIYKTLKLFVLIASLAALSIIVFIAGGITINEIYFSIPKNQFGPYFVQAILIGFYLLIPTPNNQQIKSSNLLYALIIPLVLVLLVMRSRTAMIALFSSDS